MKTFTVHLSNGRIVDVRAAKYSNDDVWLSFFNDKEEPVASLKMPQVDYLVVQV